MTSWISLWQNWGTPLIGGLLLAVCLLFCLRFVFPALQRDRLLGDATRRLHLLGNEGEGSERPLRCAEIFAAPSLARLWRDYAQTLHRSQTAGHSASFRATTSAAQYFTEQALVDTPLKTGFYKHLPGILTGLGIIGTFSGLISGLNSFQVSSEAQAVRGSLEQLIHSVGHAFQVSALAIALAMLITWVEKSLTTRLYRRVEALAEAIDSLFEAGIGEEYLARLVQASEAAAQQGAQLRQALVSDLRQSLQTLMQEQQAAMREQQAALGRSVADAVARTLQQTLAEPLTRMTTALEGLGLQQNQQLGQALENTLNRFSQHFDQRLGRGHDELGQLLARTSQGMSQMVGELGRLSQRLENSGQNALQGATGQLQHAGKDVRLAGESLQGIGREMAEAARAMNGAAQTASLAIVEQSRVQESIAQLVGDLRATVELARREAGLTQPLVARLEQAASTLATTQTRADDYLQAVNRVLGESHQAFAQHMEQTLAQGNQQFQRSVVAAVEALEGAVEELSDALNSGLARR